MSSAESNLSFKSLWERKFLQYLGSYLAVGFGLLQFLEFTSNRYDWPASIVDRYLFIWLATLPAVALLIFYQGQLPVKHSKNRWSWQRLVVWGNIVLAGLLSLFLFKSISSVAGETQHVSITDEAGDTVQAVVPALDRIKTLAAFQFAPAEANSTTAWWGVAFSYLLTMDLRQRPEFYPQSEYELISYFDKFNLEMFDIPNLAIQRSIAQRARTDYFTRGDYSIQDGVYQITGKLYRSKDGKDVLDFKAQSSDPFEVIDQISEQITTGIPNPFQTTELITDLPSAALVTDNIEALHALTDGRIMFYKDPGNLPPVYELGKKSIELDPSCAVCHYNTGDPLYGMGRRNEAIEELKKAAQLSRSLPLRMQFYLKGTLYSVQGEKEKLYKLSETHRQLFPYDYSAYTALVNHYKTNYGIDSAIYLMREAINNGHQERGMLGLFDLQLEAKDYTAAESTLDNYFEAFPERNEDRRRYANLYELQNKYTAAKAVYLEQITLDPFNIEMIARLSFLEHNQGNYTTADSLLNMALATGSSLSDSLTVLRSKIQFATNQGKIKEALSLTAFTDKLAERRLPINRILINSFGGKVLAYISIGNYTAADSVLADLEVYSPELIPAYDCYLKLQLVTEGDTASIQLGELEDCQQIYAGFGTLYQRQAEMALQHIRGDHKAAAETLKAIRALDSSGSHYAALEARIYRLAGDKDAALALVQEYINANKGEPRLYYEQALVYADNDLTKAQDALQKALATWSSADADFIPAQKARALATRLGM